MKRKLLLIISVFSLITLLMFSLPAMATAKEPLKVDKENPVLAKDVELAKKVQIKGDKGPAKPPKPVTNAATGTLGSTVSGTKYAIVIGISDYPGTANDLNYCDDGAQDMINALVNVYDLNPANIKSFIDAEGNGAVNAKRSDILTYIESLEVSTDDEVVFFYSGHGGRGKAADGDGELTDECIWVHDGSKPVPIWDGELASVFSGFTSRMIFIFDSCYAGGMTDLNGTNRIEAMASTEKTLSYELSTLKNGEFTYYMIEKGMTGDLAAINYPQGNYVTIESAWDYAKNNCRSDSITIKDSFALDLLP